MRPMFIAIKHHSISHLSTPIRVCNNPFSPFVLVQPCATVCNHHARRGARRTTKNEESIQCKHTWTMHYSSHIAREKRHPPALESHVITRKEPHFKESLSDGGRQACPRCTCVAYDSIAFPTPRRRSMQMICIKEEAGSCIDEVSPYDSLPPMCPRTGLDFPLSQITCRVKVSPIEITNGDFAGQSTIVAAMSMKVHGGSPRAMHKSNACVGQTGEVSLHKFIYTSQQWLHFGGPCGSCNLLAKDWECLISPNKEPPIVSAMSLNLLLTPCMT